MKGIVIALVLGLSGGTAVVADNSLPGDVLYGIKVGVNENVKSALSISARGEAETHIALLEERLAEAAELSVRGELEADVQARIKANFDEHAERIEELSVELQENGDAKAVAEINAKLEQSLKAHEDILLKLRTDADENTRVLLDAVILQVRNETANAQETRMEAESQVSVDALLETGVGVDKDTEADVDAETRVDVETKAEVDLDTNLDANSQVDSKSKLEGSTNGNLNLSI